LQHHDAVAFHVDCEVVVELTDILLSPEVSYLLSALKRRILPAKRYRHLHLGAIKQADRQRAVG
jgi:hypothetical protein